MSPRGGRYFQRGARFRRALRQRARILFRLRRSLSQAIRRQE